MIPHRRCLATFHPEALRVTSNDLIKVLPLFLVCAPDLVVALSYRCLVEVTSFPRLQRWPPQRLVQLVSLLGNFLSQSWKHLFLTFLLAFVLVAVLRALESTLELGVPHGFGLLVRTRTDKHLPRVLSRVSR